MQIRTRFARPATILLPALGLALGAAGAARAAAPYPTNQCVSTKQAKAGTYCKAVLRTLGRWDAEQNDAKRDAALQKAAVMLDGAWGKAEAKASRQGVDCSETTLSSAAARSAVDSAAGAILGDVNDGLDLGADGACGRKLLKAAGVACDRLLEAESGFVRALARDPEGEKRARRRARARKAFARRWAEVVARGCPTTATEDDVAGAVDTLVARLVTDTIVSPHVDATRFTTITPTGPIEYEGKTLHPTCMDGSPYAYFVKRGTVNKLLIYYQGGGACWESTTCGLPACDTNVAPNGSDNPNNRNSGFADLDDPANPFRDWNIVFVSYCSCDIHYGDAAQDYPAILFPAIHVEHRGYHNARTVEKWTREHFVNPERVFVSGTSAGAYGAWFNAPLHQFIWPASHFDVLADAGNGVITQEFLDNEFPNWNFAGNLPDTIPGLQETLNDGTGIPGYTKVVTDFFPDTRWAHYSTAFDGGTGGQTGFFQVMRNPGNISAWLDWWESSCAFNEKMREQVIATAADVTNDNYRYYIGTGSRHGMWGNDKVYTDTTGGVPRLVDWVNAMLDGSALWTNVECTNCGLLLPGDVRPSPLQPPFTQVGPDVVIDCAPASPSGAFLRP